MLITKLKLNYFGQFHNREIELKPGVNLIYGENEAGKTTIHTFIKGMLFGIERLRGRGAATKDDLYTKYLPWDYSGAFGGQMDILVGDRKYRLQRSFHANDKSFIVLDLETGREIKLREGLISELIPGLTESTFRNTISIEQLKAQTDSELASQVRNYITNLSIAKSKEVNVAKAVTSLADQKKALEAELNTSELRTLKAEIVEGMEKEEKMDSLTLTLRDLLSEDKELTAMKETAAASMDNEAAVRMEQLPAILEKFRTYRELTRQAAELSGRLDEIKGKISSWEEEVKSAGAIKADIAEAGRISLELPELEKIHNGQIKESEEAVHKSKGRNLLISGLIALGTSLPSFFLIKPVSAGAAVAVGLIIASVILLFVLNRISKNRNKNYEAKINEITNQISASENLMASICKKNKVATRSELNAKQEETIKSSYALEHGGQQLSELIKRADEVNDKIDFLQEEIISYMQYFIPEEEINTDSIQRLSEVIRQRRQEILRSQAELNKQYDACRFQIEKLRWDISSLEGNEEELIKNKDKFARLEQKQAENTVELEAVKLALGTIQALSADIHDSFGRELNQTISGIIGEVTGQRYTDLKVDEKLDIKVGWNGDYVFLDRLSAGTIDQVYFALRLAVADLLLGRNGMPVLLDDSFTLYDENRIKTALGQIAGREQVILFSCHLREKRIMEELGMPYHYVDLSV